MIQVNFKKALFINNGPEVGNMYEVGETSQVGQRKETDEVEDRGHELLESNIIAT